MKTIDDNYTPVTPPRPLHTYMWRGRAFGTCSPKLDRWDSYDEVENNVIISVDPAYHGDINGTDALIERAMNEVDAYEQLMNEAGYEIGGENVITKTKRTRKYKSEIKKRRK